VGVFGIVFQRAIKENTNFHAESFIINFPVVKGERTKRLETMEKIDRPEMMINQSIFHSFLSFLLISARKTSLKKISFSCGRGVYRERGQFGDINAIVVNIWTKIFLILF
jgi:hypothetical protein